MVLVLLLSVAVMVMPALTMRIALAPDQTKNPQEVATMATLQTVRDALVGQGGVLENLAHQPSAVPLKPSELVRESAPIQLQQTAPELAKYQPYLGIGWRGPYVLPSGINELGELTIVDGWGNEIAIRAEYAEPRDGSQPMLKNLHIISGGPNGAIEFAPWHSGWRDAPDEFPDHDDLVVSVPVMSEQP